MKEMVFIFKTFNHSLFKFFFKSQKTTHHSSAFTLAEVLIVLGIIGIVAAITIPALVAKYQTSVLISETKKAYSTLTNALNSYTSDNGAIGDYSSIFDPQYSSYDIINNLNKYIKFEAICNNVNDKKCGGPYSVKFATPRNNGFGENGSSAIMESNGRGILSDGTIVSIFNDNQTSGGGCFFYWNRMDTDTNGNYIKNSDGSYKSTTYSSSRCGRIAFDVNGIKKPNTIGEDIFTLQVMSKNISSMDEEGNWQKPIVENKLQDTINYNVGNKYQ